MKMTQTQKIGMRQINIELIESFHDDLGWLLLDLSDEDKHRIIEENKKQRIGGQHDRP